MYVYSNKHIHLNLWCELKPTLVTAVTEYYTPTQQLDFKTLLTLWYKKGILNY